MRRRRRPGEVAARSCEQQAPRSLTRSPIARRSAATTRRDAARRPGGRRRRGAPRRRHGGSRPRPRARAPVPWPWRLEEHRHPRRHQRSPAAAERLAVCAHRRHRRRPPGSKSVASMPPPADLDPLESGTFSRRASTGSGCRASPWSTVDGAAGGRFDRRRRDRDDAAYRLTGSLVQRGPAGRLRVVAGDARAGRSTRSSGTLPPAPQVRGTGRARALRSVGVVHLRRRRRSESASKPGLVGDFGVMH